MEGTMAIPGEGLYSVNDNYTYTHSTGRVGHINGINTADLNTLEAGSHEALSNPVPGIYILSYDFTSLDTKILLGNDFVIGYSPYCANGVLLAYADGNGPSCKARGRYRVPEPAIMILFGAGTATLAD